MERGVFIGGVLIAASLMIAVLLNSKSSRESEPAPATEDTTSQSVPKSVAMQPQSKLDRAGPCVHAYRQFCSSVSGAGFAFPTPIALSN